MRRGCLAALFPASFQPHLAGPGRRGRRLDGVERLVLPVDAAPLRRQRAAPGHAGPTTTSWPETRGTDCDCDCDAICHGSMPSTVPVDAYNRHPVHSYL